MIIWTMFWIFGAVWTVKTAMWFLAWSFVRGRDGGIFVFILGVIVVLIEIQLLITYFPK